MLTELQVKEVWLQLPSLSQLTFIKMFVWCITSASSWTPPPTSSESRKGSFCFRGKQHQCLNSTTANSTHSCRKTQANLSCHLCNMQHLSNHVGNTLPSVCPLKKPETCPCFSANYGEMLPSLPTEHASSFFQLSGRVLEHEKALDTAFVQQNGPSVSFSTCWLLRYVLQRCSQQLRTDVLCLKKGLKNSDEKLFLLLTGGIFRTTSMAPLCRKH